MLGETSDSHPDAAVQYIHTENSYEPLARVDSHGEHADIFWYYTERNGLPDSVTDSNGETVWRGTSSAWGRSLRESTPVNWDTPQNLRFQGQYLDRETGLHYNTFRYYDPAGGCYTQMDPIGLAGGLNLYSYAPNPIKWIDPLGLHDILADTDIVCRGGACSADSFKNGSGVAADTNGKLSGISIQAKPNAGLETLSQPFKHNQIGVATVADIEKAGGTITLDGKLNSSNGSMMMNHATVDGLTAEQA
ncbi:hypothetical protein HF650_01505 [Kosakonia sp. SMBL-WEM22]|nr:hypothetical protein HF650_01505 [Kosakonia sp. SMBL-WEM22]